MLKLSSTYRDRVMPSKAIDKDVDVIATVKSDTQRDGVSSDHTLANSHHAFADFYFHSNRHSRFDRDSFPSRPIPPPPPLRPSKMPWLYIAVGLTIAGLASFIFKKWKPKPVIAGPLAFYAHSNWDAPQKPPENVSIKYGLYFHPNVSAGQDRHRD